jgi:hypothetical protein
MTRGAEIDSQMLTERPSENRPHIEILGVTLWRSSATRQLNSFKLRHLPPKRLGDQPSAKRRLKGSKPP